MRGIPNQKVYPSKQDAASLNILFGKALLDEDFRQNLLKKERRNLILTNCPLTFGVFRYLMTLPDKEKLDELAEEVYTLFII